jgi:hypothetical protein
MNPLMRAGSFFLGAFDFLDGEQCFQIFAVFGAICWQARLPSAYSS